MVRAPALRPETLIQSLEAGDFYASSGVRLRRIEATASSYQVWIDGESGVTYRTVFIGTRRGFDAQHEPVRTPGGEALRVTHRYSSSVGAVLAEMQGLRPRYELQGDELYVRAKVISSKPKAYAHAPDEREVAWTQPLVPSRAPPSPPRSR
jgi:hypothetical protein